MTSSRALLTFIGATSAGSAGVISRSHRLSCHSRTWNTHRLSRNTVRLSSFLLWWSATSAASAAHLVRDRPAHLTCQAAMASSAAVDTCDSNPLLHDGLFPLWSSVTPSHVVPGIRALLTDSERMVEELEQNLNRVTDAGGVVPISDIAGPLETVGDRLMRAWGVVNHLKSTKDTEELRAAVEEVQPEVVKFNLRLASSQPIYLAFKALSESKPHFDALTEAQRRIVDGEMLQATLSGVNLEGSDKVRFDEIQQRLSQLSTKFSNNVLDATKSWSKRVTDKDEIAGLPESILAQLAESAKSKGDEAATLEEGPWVVTLSPSVYVAVMQYADSRDLRAEVYRAYLTRASDQGTDLTIDNAPLIGEILQLRKEKARLLGKASHAEVSCESKMATPQSAMELMEELREASFQRAKGELAELQEFANSVGCEGDLKQWDVSYYAEKLRQQKFDFSEEELKAYFPLDRVLDGLFGLVRRLFGVYIVPADAEDAPTWHPDVKLFRVQASEDSTTPLAYFYLDPYARPEEKRGGAWMDEVAGRSKVLSPADSEVRVPVAHMVCNGSPPVGNKPSLLTFREVETVFHEGGHMLQHVLTKQDEGLVAGIRGIEWDAVECPSQFMENWCYDRDTLDTMAIHYETGERLPDDLFQKIVKAKTFRAASGMVRQLHFSLVDLVLHSDKFDPSADSAFAVDRQVAKTCSVLEPLEFDRFLCSFSHIFAGGYSAGYFSYKWAEVLSADCFGAFEEVGLGNESAVVGTGKRFADTVLGMGGGRRPELVFEDFRGRPPSSEALLRHNGLLAAASR